MGCNSSKIVDVGRQEKVFTLFDPIKADEIQNAWTERTYEDKIEIGKAIMVEIMNNSQIRQVFGFMTGNKEILNDDPRFLMHVEQFIGALDFFIKHIHHVNSEVRNVFLEIGKRHRTIPGYSIIYFDEFIKIVDAELQRTIGEPFNSETNKKITGCVKKWIEEGILSKSISKPSVYKNIAAGAAGMEEVNGI